MVVIERVRGGAHYTFDVAAGAVIGPAATALVRAVPRLFFRCLRWPNG
ncbi:hypothetical protein [Streptomyces sp. NPDC002054]